MSVQRPDQGGRKHWLSGALDLLRATKGSTVVCRCTKHFTFNVEYRLQRFAGRNIIFTSDALYPIHMRAPHDLVNLYVTLDVCQRTTSSGEKS